MGEVKFVSNNSFEYLCNIEEVECTPIQASNPMGEIANGRLVIPGHVIEENLEIPDDEEDGGMGVVLQSNEISDDYPV